MLCGVPGDGERQKFINIRQPFKVPGSQLASFAIELIDAMELPQPQYRRHVSHIIFKSRFQHLCLGGAALGLSVISVHTQAMKFQTTDPFRHFFVIGTEHPAFTGGNIFDGVEGKNGCSL